MLLLPSSSAVPRLITVTLLVQPHDHRLPAWSSLRAQPDSSLVQGRGAGGGGEQLEGQAPPTQELGGVGTACGSCKSTPRWEHIQQARICSGSARPPVMRNFVQETVFRHNWSFVSPAVWRKYPNSKSPDVTNVDILSRDVVDGKLHTRRLISCANPVPAFWRRVFGGLPAETYMLEESIVDPVRRTMEMTTRNITLKNVLEVQELCVYREAGNNTSWTQMSQEFSCSICGTSLSGMGTMVAKAEQAIINRVQSNAGKGPAILNEVVEGLMKTDLKKRADALKLAL